MYIILGLNFTYVIIYYIDDIIINDDKDDDIKAFKLEILIYN